MTIPKQGGATGFMDKIKLYDSLPVELKQAIVGRDIIYKAHFDISRQKYALEGTIDVLQLNPRLEHMIAKEDEDFPRVLHPAVITQPETGRKLLNVSPLFAERVEGLPIDESHELLSSLAAHIRKEEFAYFHQWSHDDLVLWDNWRMLHSALGIDPSVERIMQRTTIAGDYAQGRYLTT
jgi:taurine dioxygenase